jgi:hypothetical protein
MIKLIFSTLILMHVYADFSPFQKDQNGNLFYKSEHQYPSKTKAQLYSQFRLWVAENFNDPKSVTVFEDEQTGTIIIRPLTSFYVGNSELKAHFSLKVIFTDGKGDFTYNNFEIWYPQGVRHALEGYNRSVHFDKSGNMKPASYKTVGPYIDAVLNFDGRINL